MNITFTFEPNQEMQQQLTGQFPNHRFVFSRGQAPCSDTEIWVTYGEDVKEETIQSLPNLKWLSVASAGIEKMPLPRLQANSIKVTNARGIHKTPMAESIMGHILSLYRNLPALYELNTKREWDKPRGAIELRGRTAIILGPGAIGMEVARLLTAFGVNVIACNRSGKPVEHTTETISFEELQDRLPEADIVLSLLPSTVETRHMLGEDHFKAMKSSAIFMNFGRGDVVDEHVLVTALQQEEIGYAVLDVFEVEPLPESSGLWNLDQAIISPHISSHSSNYVERAMEIFSRNLTRYEQNDHSLENEVDLLKGY